ncbi:DUF1592 domain-containing protein [Fuerstiella marisgermanici]|uniref:Gluconolactonase n=1 Tax=Fuerstiella marisgermanici TaxID=1891926 RepID=A0A1P8WQC9_9PLAN|nr:DUF1592 domain-containing protein [Fuerstiella marisgermanici]APZ96244.1 Gluconolactonase [Fuerstiella marisgermanici]
MQRNILTLVTVPFFLAAQLSLATADEEQATAPEEFTKQVKPFLELHCVGCHSSDGAEAGINFEKYTDSARIQTDYELWEKVRRLIRDRQMPPAEETQPTADELTDILDSLQAQLDSFDCSSDQHPGRVTLRRLNKAEFNNTIRDLTGLQLNLADDFPSDDVGEGFDNIGDVLTIPPVLLEKYLAAAQTVAQQIMSDEAAKKRVLPHTAESAEEMVEAARQNIREFATLAWRRPITDAEGDRLFAIMKLAWERDSKPDEIFETAITAVLANPHFLFRVEADPTDDDKDGIRSLNGYELASRLSYFLWSTMPDEELFKLAASGELTKPEVLAAQAKRMLADPKSVALIDNFAGQWLQLRDVTKLKPDPDQFPTFDAELQLAMRRETESFFENMIREDRSVLEFLTADYTFVNERLAKHYGMKDVTGDQFQKVAMAKGRRGVLTHSSILLLTSNPTRTSPVKRGKWVLENILAEPPPPPPPDVPELEEGGETLGSLREQMEQHRSNPACAVCHVKMDAVGFGMENFDAIGAWRDRDGRFEVNAAGELPGGKKFDGASELMQILAEDNKTEFLRCLSGKMLVYALGRGLVSYDRCVVNDVVASLEENDHRFSSLVTAIVQSDAFRKREAK